MNPRTTKLLIGLGIAAGILIVKLFAIQIVNDRYKRDASNNSMVYDVIYPTRGIIYDRGGKIIVGNTGWVSTGQARAMNRLPLSLKRPSAGAEMLEYASFTGLSISGYEIREFNIILQRDGKYLYL